MQQASATDDRQLYAQSRRKSLSSSANIGIFFVCLSNDYSRMLRAGMYKVFPQEFLVRARTRFYGSERNRATMKRGANLASKFGGTLEHPLSVFEDRGNFLRERITALRRSKRNYDVSGVAPKVLIAYREVENIDGCAQRISAEDFT